LESDHLVRAASTMGDQHDQVDHEGDGQYNQISNSFGDQYDQVDVQDNWSRHIQHVEKNDDAARSISK
jgi:hypothetical protein